MIPGPSTPPQRVEPDAIRGEQALCKEPMLQRVFSEDGSPLKRYQSFYVGHDGWGALLRFEVLTTLFGSMPGALGLLLRKWCYPALFRKVGSGVLWGRNISLRHPGKIELGDRVAIDENCLLNAERAGTEGIRIGNDVVIARDSIIQAKNAWITIGNRCTVGSQCQLSSPGGITIGNSVMIAAQCYLGGGRYRIDDTSVPMKDQGLYTKGPVIIEDDVWLGAGVIVQDGVRIGKGCVVGSGAVIREDLPAYTVVVPHQKLIMLPRGLSDARTTG